MIQSLHFCVSHCLNSSQGICPLDWWWLLGLFPVFTYLWSLLQWAVLSIYPFVQMVNFLWSTSIFRSRAAKVIIYTCNTTGDRLFSRLRAEHTCLPLCARQCWLLSYCIFCCGSFSIFTHLEHLLLCSLDACMLLCECLIMAFVQFVCVWGGVVCPIIITAT